MKPSLRKDIAMCKHTKTHCCQNRTSQTETVANAILTPFVILVAIPALVIELITN